MATPEEIAAFEATLLTNASGPKSAQTDMGSMAQHDLSDQIAYLEWLESRPVTTRVKRGLRFSKLCPPGAD